MFHERSNSMGFPILLVLIVTLSWSGVNAQCRDRSPSCNRLARSGFCQYTFWTSHMYYKMRRSCPLSCGLCQCTQRRRSCVSWAANGYCKRSRRFMESNCAISCGLCGCKDDHVKCKRWTRDNYCTKRPRYMHVYCRKSCNVCRCADLSLQCRKWIRQGFCATNRQFMDAHCRKSCKFCGVKPPKRPKTGVVNSKYCGLASRKRVVGGREVTPGKWPWMVGLVRSKNKKKIICGASLITDEWVLSAAHCFIKEGGSDPKNYYLILGEHHLFKTESHEKIVKINKIILHPKFNKVTFDNDIALLHMKVKVTFSKYVSPTCLIDSRDKFPIGTKCTISGWGALSEDVPGPNVLHAAQVPLVSHSVCNNAYAKLRQSITNNMICAGHTAGGTDTCEGDSGGPLICRRNGKGRYEQVGIVSWGYGCARKGLYGVYTNLKLYRKWIDSVIKG